MVKIKFNTFNYEPYRIIEQQTQFASLKIVPAEDFDVLENLIEKNKPPIPVGYEDDDILLTTPFRYNPPLKSGSRFGSSLENAIWYGSQEIKTAFAEKSYYLFKFLEDSPDLKLMANLVVQWSSYRSQLKSRKGVDLCTKKYSKQKALISSPLSYKGSQSLGRDLRKKGCEAIKFISSRCKDGKNFAVFTPSVLSTVSEKTHWIAQWQNDLISIRPFDGANQKINLEFKLQQFMVGNKFPAP